MSLYPSLEDMKVGHLAQAQVQMGDQFNVPQYMSSGPSAPPSNELPYPLSPPQSQSGRDLSHLYPALNEYMGLEFTEDVIAANMPEYMSVVERQPGTVGNIGICVGQDSMIAPLSASNVGFQRAQLSHGIREVVVCKGSDGKIGLRVKDINKGVFICLVKKGSPAAIAGLRFGDQILQLNGENVAGYSMDKMHDLFKKCPSNGITLAVRDRPFERTITLHKDSSNHIGFQFKDGEITAIVKDSSAARNGLLINHYLLEVNGQNVVGLKDKEVTAIINECGQIVTVTVMPSFIYGHIVKQMSSSLMTKLMDHSVPDI